MSNPIIEELKTLRDEIKVQLHLLTLDSKDKYQELETKVEGMLKEFGEFNEELWAGNKDEIKSLIDEYKKIKKNFNVKQ